MVEIASKVPHLYELLLRRYPKRSLFRQTLTDKQVINETLSFSANSLTIEQKAILPDENEALLLERLSKEQREALLSLLPDDWQTLMILEEEKNVEIQRKIYQWAYTNSRVRSLAACKNCHPITSPSDVYLFLLKESPVWQNFALTNDIEGLMILCHEYDHLLLELDQEHPGYLALLRKMKEAYPLEFKPALHSRLLFSEDL